LAETGRYLRNCWYVVALADELDGQDTLARKILNEPILMLKDEQGEWSAISDRCPHRFAPLSKGTAASGTVTCAYHGLAFNGKGACTHNPHGPITAALVVKNYPVRLVGPLLWIWMGDPALAEDIVPSAYDWSVDGSHAIGMGYIHGLAHYELMTDNIMDLSHIEFLHPLLGSEAVSKAKVDVTAHGEQIVATRRMTDETLSEPLARTYRTDGERVNRELRVEWRAPALMELTVTVEPLQPSAAPPRGSRTLHLFTPETDRSTHYFYVCGMDKDTTPPEIAVGFRQALERVFLNEDKPMIDAQQATIGFGADIMDLKPAMLAIDKAPVMVRRQLLKLIALEPAG